MALWCDPLDELIADLERTLPVQATPTVPDYARQLIEMQFLMAEIARTTPRTPLKPHPCDDPTQQSIPADLKPTSSDR